MRRPMTERNDGGNDVTLAAARGQNHALELDAQTRGGIGKITPNLLVAARSLKTNAVHYEPLACPG